MTRAKTGQGFPFLCGNCGGELPERFARRRIPNRGGRSLPVCLACARVIDSQGQLAAPTGQPLGGA